MSDKLETRALELGNQIFDLSSQSSMSLFDKGFWSGKMMDWSMKNHDFKVQMFRFVDVLPVLNEASQINQHIKEYFVDEASKIPSTMRAAMGVASAGGLIGKMAAGSIRKNVESMAQMFIAGAHSADAFPSLEKNWKKDRAFTVDILGEAVVSESEAKSYQERYLELVTGLADKVKAWDYKEVLENGGDFKLPRANVSVKCSSLYSQISSYSHRKSVDVIKERLRPILQAAVEREVCVNLDMEQVDYKDIILTVAEELFMEEEFRSYPYLGLVLQCYLRSAPEDCGRVVSFAKSRGVPLTVRLVKGAYWDYEVIKAKENDWPIPVFTNKADSDACFETCTEIMLRAHPHVLTALGSHNVRNLAYGMALAESLNIPQSALEIQMLYGMADPFKEAVSKMGYRLREYVPVGEMLPGMAYLVRRLLENTSNEGFLRAKYVDQAQQLALLRRPSDIVAERAAKIAAEVEGGGDSQYLPEDHEQKQKQKTKALFANQPPLDFAIAEHRSTLTRALQEVKQKYPLRAYPFVNGRRREEFSWGTHVSPNDATLTVSEYALSDSSLADEAAEVASAAMKKWSREFSASTRISLVRELAAKMRERRFELMAIMMDEVSKTGPEADGDVCEAIDFCEFYAQEMERFSKVQERAFLPGESNEYFYEGKGPALVIAPWNFPLAILCGMTVAPLLAGNTVIMKPAEQSSGIASVLYDMIREVGFPHDVVQFLPGKGEVVGAQLVKHPKIQIVNFTGSRDVGLKILQEAYTPRPGQQHIKKVVAELGGKNAQYIDDDADMDEAVLGVLKAAFHFQGQKCSALSRVLVHEANFDVFVDRLKEGLLSMNVGQPSDFANKVCAVIDRETQKRLLQVIEENSAKVFAQAEVSESMIESGNFVPPTLFVDEDYSSALSQTEHFGPLLVVHKVKDMDEALSILNDTDYALTGGIYSRSPRNIERFKKEAQVGNLYVNRGVTGSIVSRQPFGGFKMSGVGAKAGGPDYLLQFMNPRTQTENLMRRGFTPEL